MTKYSFNEELDLSKQRQYLDILAIRSMINGCTEVKPTDKEMDEKGADYIAKIGNGSPIYIDAKTRLKGCSKYWTNNTPELAIERWSVMPDSDNVGKVGWTLDEAKITEIILYTFDEADCPRSYMLPAIFLRMAAIRNIDNWYKRYKVDRQSSSNHNKWKSEAVFVPVDVVLKAIRNTLEWESDEF